MTSDALTNDVDVLRQWIGRTQTSTDVITPEACERLAHALGRAEGPTEGQPLPPLWHFAFHIRSVPLHQLGPDGHPTRGGFTPPIALPRRMWAGSRVRFDRDILVGDEVAKTRRSPTSS